MMSHQPIRGIVVCVGYDDLLAITLPRNLAHLDSCVVVTSPTDVATKTLCQQFPQVTVYETDAFYRYGAKFNKGLAMEEGFDVLGRDGWILIWDADTLFPSPMRIPRLRKGFLYGARRHLLKDPAKWSEAINWSKLPIVRDAVTPGYFQLFHASDPAIASHPWYDVTFAHAGGGDGYFQSRWDYRRKARFPWRVLHLGPVDTNWFGRATPRIDGGANPDAAKHAADMETFLRFKGWHRPASVDSFNEKVDVPGAIETGFKLKGAKDRHGHS
jgi:hypothetical protein